MPYLTAVLLILVGAIVGVLVEERREQARAVARARAGSLAFNREATAALQHAFMDYVAAEGVPIDEELPQVFANWLANETGQTIVARQVDGDGIVIAMPDEED